MGTFQNWVAPFMYGCTTKTTVDSRIVWPPVAMIEPADYIFCGICRTTFQTTLGIVPFGYFRARSDVKNQRRVLWGITRYFVYCGAVFVYDWRIGILFVVVPLLCMNFIMAITRWVQHAFCDPEHPEDYFATTVTLCDEANFMNEGYHLCHHHRSGLHWTEMPAHLERIRVRQSGSLVFRPWFVDPGFYATFH
jgi:hypothetical protein